jgi:polar amino acid transport system substrate-binding protein
LYLSPSLSAKSISLRADIWCPYNCDPQSDRPGFFIEIARQVFKKHGYEIDYETTNWQRAKEEGEKGLIDGIVGAYKEDAPDFIFPQEPLGYSENLLYVLQNSDWKFTGVESLPGKTIGVIKGYTYDPLIDKLVSAGNPHFLIVGGEDALDRLIKMAQTNRIDGLYEDRNVFSSKLKSLHIPENSFKSAGQFKKKRSECYIAFSPKRKSAFLYAKILTEGMRELRKNGELAQILQKYGIKDFK